MKLEDVTRGPVIQEKHIAFLELNVLLILCYCKLSVPLVVVIFHMVVSQITEVPY